MAAYTPTLGLIKEEPARMASTYSGHSGGLRRQQGSFDESILLEYAILNDEDLKEAYSNNNSSNIHNENISNNRILKDCCSSADNVSSIYSSTTTNSMASSSFDRSLSFSLSASAKSMDGTSDTTVELPKISTESANLPLENEYTKFNLVQGKKMFIRAIQHKYMNIYYVIGQQRLCGEFSANQSIAAFILAMNSLDFEMGNADELKGNYFKTHSVSREMSFTDIACITRENHLSAEVSQVFKNSSILNFRKAVKLSCKSSNIILLCAYRGSNMKEQFSLVGGYFKGRDEILLLTPSKSKLHAHWIPVIPMWKILQNDANPMTARKGTTKNITPGGYMLLQKNEDNARIAVRIHKNALLCLQTSTSEVSSRNMVFLLKNWRKWLSQPLRDVTENSLVQGINFVLHNLTSHTVSSQYRSGNENRMLSCRYGSLSDLISNTEVYKVVQRQINNLPTDSLKMVEVFSEWVISIIYWPKSAEVASERKLKVNFKKMGKKSGAKTRPPCKIYYDSLMLTLCLLFWPYHSVGRDNSNASAIEGCIKSDLLTFPLDVVVRIQEQLKFVVSVMLYAEISCSGGSASSGSTAGRI